MPTVKDIAEMAGISASTVSIVLTGKAQKRGITLKTQERIWKAARTLGYLPNISAKSLRDVKENTSLYIMVFWAGDSRISMLARFLRGLQTAMADYDGPCEVLLNPYTNGNLDKSMTNRVMSLCHGAIICNANEQDMEYLQEADGIEKPIVLYNRHTDQYSTVVVDDANIGVKAAEVFAQKGCRRAAILTLDRGFGGRTGLRTVSFEQRCKEMGIRIINISAVDNSMRGGYNGAIGLSMLEDKVDCLFCASDTIALGAIKGFHDAGVRIPEQVRLISAGNGDQEQETYSIPSLSVVNIPIDKMAEQCMHLLYKHITYEENSIRSIMVETMYIPRESCPE